MRPQDQDSLICVGTIRKVRCNKFLYNKQSTLTTQFGDTLEKFPSVVEKGLNNRIIYYSR